MQKVTDNKFHFLEALSIIYVVLPVMLFSFGWLKYYFSVPVSLALIYFSICLYKELASDKISLFNKNSALFWIIVFISVCVWVFLSGIGGFSFQNYDHIIRNPIYRDLCNYEWPVVYDFSLQNEYIQSMLGTGPAAMVYYFSWWLPPALLSKIFQLGRFGQDTVLYVWAAAGMMLIVYNLCRYFKRILYIIPVIFIFFSGLDIIGFFINSWHFYGFNNISSSIFMSHLEWWARRFQYSSNSSLLYWVFNQAIPAWLIVIMFLQLRSSKNSPALCSLTFAYSPWAAIGIIPVTFASLFHDGRKFRSSFTSQNILIVLIMLVIYGAFYISGNADSIEGKSGFTIEKIKNLGTYIIFIFLEAGVYFVIMGRTAEKYKFYYTVMAELIIFPLYKVITVDFIMRASIPALFILMIFVMKFLIEEGSASLRVRKILLICALIIGSFTAFSEMNRSIYALFAYYTGNEKAMSKVTHIADFGFPMENLLIRDEVYSLGKCRIESNDTVLLDLIKNQYITHDLEGSFFFDYLAK